MDKWMELPDLIKPSVVLEKPNEPIRIYRGIFVLRQNNIEFNINGEIVFEWFPDIGATFTGQFQGEENLINQLNQNHEFFILVDSSLLGRAHLSRISIDVDTRVEGRLTGEVVFGDKSIAVSRVDFTIPNLRHFNGESVKSINGSKRSLSNSRLTFNNDKYLIQIDKVQDFDRRKQRLSVTGGFDILYAGRIEKKSGSIRHSELHELITCLSYFLSFLNGRRCCPVILKGIHQDETIWTDYSGYQTNIFKSVLSWPSRVTSSGLGEIWSNWYKLFSDESDRDFLTTVVHWYTEANSNAALVEGSVMLVQTALELVYNWFIVERKGILLGSDATGISASNKIRILLNQLNADYQIPTTLQNLTIYRNSLPEQIDGPESFVRIRNAIVHANEDKRRMLANVPLLARYEALQLGLWYVELAMLKILEFKGVYQNRTKPPGWPGDNEERLPAI